MQKLLLEKFHTNREKVDLWLKDLEKQYKPPLYTSTDIRDGGFKTTVVDANLFPAGFNNLSHGARNYATDLMTRFLLKNFRHAKKALLIVEENTRNKYYLENVRVLADMLRLAGLQIIITTSENPQGEFENDENYIELQTASENTLRVYSPHYIQKKLANNEIEFDLGILNNDLIKEEPQWLRDLHFPVIPDIIGGWHSRRKSSHFEHYNSLVKEMAKLLQLDEWFFSSEIETVHRVDVNNEDDRKKLYKTACKLQSRIQAKYDQYNIKDKPFIFMKADFGTYGMGILPIEDPQELLNLNRKKRNKLFKGKGSVPVICYLLQEGVPTVYKINDHTAEVCLYQIGNKYTGSFFRIHSDKSGMQNLNSKGAYFLPVEVSSKEHLKQNEVHSNHIDLYHMLSRIAQIASMQELAQLNRGFENELCIPS